MSRLHIATARRRKYDGWVKRLRTHVFSLLALASSTACSGGSAASTAPEAYGLPRDAYTLVNLHPDETKQLMYSVNYQQGGLIPLCTPVTIHSVSNRGMEFSIKETGRRYDYVFHDSMLYTPEQHLAMYFGAQCEPPEARGLTPIDLDGIAQGKALPGMTKAGVVYAIGYPPRHATATLDLDEWTYWKNRWDRQLVVFADGVVAEIKD